MARRIMWDRAADPTHVYSALDSGGNAAEEGVEVDAPSDSAVSGLMEVFAGGAPSAAATRNLDIIRGGNLGSGEWGWNNGGTPFFGACVPWVIDRPGSYDRDAVINVPHRLRGYRGANTAASIFVRDTTISYRLYVRGTGWTARYDIGTVAAGSTADCLAFEDTQEIIAFCDGTLYSTFDPTDASSWAVKGTTAGFAGGATDTHIALAHTRGQLVLAYINGAKVYVRISHDRGATWDAAVCISDNFEDGLLGDADSLDMAISPTDQNFYLLIEDDTTGAGSDDRLALYRSADGLEWDQLNSDVGNWSVLSRALQNCSLLMLDDGTMVAIVIDADNGTAAAAWVDKNGLQLTRTAGGQVETTAWLGVSSDLLCAPAVSMGQEILASPMIGNIGGSNKEVLNSVLLRWWSNISEQYGYGGMCWLPNEEDGPDSGWGWTANGTGTEGLATDKITLSTTDANNQRYYNQQYGADDGDKLKFGVECVSDCDRANNRVGVRVERQNAGGFGYDFGLYFDQSGVRIYDHGAAAQLADITAGMDFSVMNDVLVDIDFDAAAGGCDISVWVRTESDGYPDDAWVNIANVTAANAAPLVGADFRIDFGNFSWVAGQTTRSVWYYMLMGVMAEGLSATYANAATDHSDLYGRACSSMPQEITDNIYAWWRGAGGAPADRWSLPTRYVYEKENVLRADPKRQWRSDDDEQIVYLVFHDDDLRPYRPDFVALFGINFEKFFIDLDDASTFDTGAGSTPEVTIQVAWGMAAGDDAVGLCAPNLNVDVVADDYIQVAPANAHAAGMWKGRYDKDKSTGRKFYLRILDGNKSGEVYRIESIQNLDDNDRASWQIRLAPNADGSYPELVDVSPVSINDKVGIFSDAIAVEIPTAYYRASGYKYVRIRIPSQETWEGDYRAGYICWGMSVPLGFRPRAAGPEPTLPKIADAEYDSSIDISPNIATITAPDGSVTKRRNGRAPRVVALRWTGQYGRSAWDSAVRSMLEAAAGDVPLVFIEDDHFQHNGPEAPSGDPAKVCYDPILAYLEGAVKTTQRGYRLYTPNECAVSLRGTFTDVAGIVMKEIV